LAYNLYEFLKKFIEIDIDAISGRKVKIYNTILKYKAEKFFHLFLWKMHRNQPYAALF